MTKDLFTPLQVEDRFYNGWGHHPFPSRKRALKWLYTRSPEWPTQPISVHTNLPVLPANEMRVIYVNHATILIQFEGLSILTDPVWSLRLGPLPTFGIRRCHLPAIAFEALPPIDVVVISHNHYDHLDAPTLKKLRKNHDFQIICPAGLESWFYRRHYTNVTALSWWENIDLSPRCRLTAVPAQHWSQRTLKDRNKSLWFGVSLTSPSQGCNHIYFAGDTGYGPHFKEIQRRLGAPSLSLLPIGSYVPRWLMEHHHMSPADAVKAHQDLASLKSLPIHFDTFPLGDEPLGQALVDLHAAREALSTPLDFDSWQAGDIKSYPLSAV